jgi:hypothetical protein
MKLLNKKKQLIFEFEEDEKGILVSAVIKGKLNDNHVLAAKSFIDNRIKECQKQKKANLKNK